jgi:hypothetical protein
MPSEKHEELLRKAIQELQNQGLRVIRLDSMVVPDAIGIDFENKKVTAVEVDTSPTGVYLTRVKYDRYPPQFDDEIIVMPRLPNSKVKSYRAYLLALELHKQGLSERRIKSEIERQLNEKVSVATVHYWVSGKVIKRY